MTSLDCICKGLELLISAWLVALIDRHWNVSFTSRPTDLENTSKHRLGSFIWYLRTKEGGGQAKAYAMRTKGRGLTYLSTYAKSPHFACILLHFHM